MSINNYKKKGKPALWTAAFPAQVLTPTHPVFTITAKQFEKGMRSLEERRSKPVKKMWFEKDKDTGLPMIKRLHTDGDITVEIAPAVSYGKLSLLKPRKRIRRESLARAAETRRYAADARAFVAAAVARGETCPVVAAIAELREGKKYGWPICARLNEVHHKFGRQGKLLIWKPGWIAVSKEGHRFLHSNIKIAIKNGWIGQVGTWNNFEKAALQVAEESK